MPADVQNLIGKAVYGENGNKVGEINDLLIGPKGRVQAALIEFGGFLGIGENQVAVDWSKLNVQPNRVTANMTENQIKSAPHWVKDMPPGAICGRACVPLILASRTEPKGRAEASSLSFLEASAARAAP